MKILGQKQHTLMARSGLYTLRVEGFQDDRFQLMFICQDSEGKDVRWILTKQRKGTKEIDLDRVWPLMEDKFLKAIDGVPA